MSSPARTAALPDTLRLGAVHLTVADLDRAVAFYRDAIGLRTQALQDRVAAMGAGGEDVVVLHEQPGARRAGRHAGLFHSALLFSSRDELARAAQRLAVSRTRVDGASDHGVSEALYLSDLDGNGIELYADRPRERWNVAADGEVEMYTRPLDVPGLLDTVAGEPARSHPDPGLVVGHVHLHVGDLGAAAGFYRDRLGLALMTTYPGALFLAAGGYHHHLGVNTWAGDGVGPAPAGTAGLREWTIVLPPDAVAAAQERLGVSGDLAEDPWGTRLRLLPAG